MTFYIYDSLSREKKKFEPINSNDIRIYACGPTVYSYAHIGNARMSVITDLLVRVLKTIYKNVKFVSNITDIDDKIIEASKNTGIKIQHITKKFHSIYNEDMQNLGVNKPDLQPKATDYIHEMITMIKSLINKEVAYVADKHVLFDVKKYKFYGVLSRRTKEEQIAGSRIEVASYKKNPEDFILWKPSKVDEPSWKSPWGEGRPGWHIECSAMSEKCLGTPFDIHCGGVDLTFPHHENEIAQSCSLIGSNCKPDKFSKYWFHNGFLTVSGEKMSKSLGNIMLVNDILKKYSGNVIRLSLLSSHYRQPIDWSEKILEQSKKTLMRFKKKLSEHDCVSKNKSNIMKNEIMEDFLKPLYDDLNTPRALAVLNGWFDKLKKNDFPDDLLIQLINKALNILGFDLKKENISETIVDENKEKEIVKMITERQIARQRKDFKKADEIREKLKKMDILIDDTSEGTKWTVHEK